MRIGKPRRGPDNERSARIPVKGGRFTFHGGWAKTTPVKVGDDPYAPTPELDRALAELDEPEAHGV